MNLKNNIRFITALPFGLIAVLLVKITDFIAGDDTDES